MNAAFGRPRKVAIQSRRCIQHQAQVVFKMTTRFVDAEDTLDRAVRRIELLDRLVARRGDLLDYSLIDFVFRVYRQDAFARCIENHFSERNPKHWSMFVQQPRDQLIDQRIGLRSCRAGASPAKHSGATTAVALKAKIALGKRINERNIGRFKIPIRE